MSHINHEVHWTFDERPDEEVWQEHLDRIEARTLAIEKRDRAIERAERNADPIWYEDALAAVEHCARAEREFTSEDVAALIGRSIREPRALGAVFRVAKDKGWITATERFVPATHPSRHRAPIRVWKSLIVVEEAA